MKRIVAALVVLLLALPAGARAEFGVGFVVGCMTGSFLGAMAMGWMDSGKREDVSREQLAEAFRRGTRLGRDKVQVYDFPLGVGAPTEPPEAA